MKKLLFVFAMSLLILLCSCSAEKTLQVKSIGLDVSVLKSGGFNAETASKGKLFNVNIINDKLCVEEAVENNINNTATVTVDNGYYIGVDVGEFGGWIAYCPYYSDFNADSEIIVDENFRGFAQIDNTKALLLTGMAHLATDEGKLYMLENGKATELFDFESMPRAFTFDGESLFVITGDKLYSYTQDGTPNIIAEIEIDLYPQSAAKIGDSLYFGCIGGIYEYCLNTGDEYWYPIE